MNYVYYILLTVSLVSFAFTRTSGNFSVPSSFAQKDSYAAKKSFIPNDDNGGEDSLKWKRRHKRRKKDKNRRPQRGR